ncbi:MAG: hypothetical protein PVJ02_12020 [Gemmatimonadota bacterium]|jgi:hypothetical protein
MNAPMRDPPGGIEEWEDPDLVRRARWIAGVGFVLVCVVFTAFEVSLWSEPDLRYLMLVGLPLLPTGWWLFRELRRPDRLLWLAAGDPELPDLSLDRVAKFPRPTDPRHLERLMEVQDAVDRMDVPDTFFGRHRGVLGTVAGVLGAAAWLAVGVTALVLVGDQVIFVLSVGMALLFGTVGWVALRHERDRRAELEDLKQGIETLLTPPDPPDGPDDD